MPELIFGHVSSVAFFMFLESVATFVFSTSAVRKKIKEINKKIVGRVKVNLLEEM